LSDQIKRLAAEAINKGETEFINFKTGRKEIIPRIEWFKNRRMMIFFAILIIALQIWVTAIAIYDVQFMNFDYMAADEMTQQWYVISNGIGIVAFISTLLLVGGIRKMAISNKVGDRSGSTGIPSVIVGIVLVVISIIWFSGIFNGIALELEPFATWTADEDDASYIVVLVIAIVQYLGGILLAMGIRGEDLAQI
jgi:membrane protease YdiL (CAAX protease family)